MEKPEYKTTDYILLYVSKNQADTLVNGRAVPVQEDQFLLLPPGTYFQYKVNKIAAANVLEFAAGNFPQLQNIPSSGVLGRNFHVGDLFYHLTMLSGRASATPFSKDALAVLLLEQALSSTLSSQPNLELYEKFRKYVEENLSGNLSAQAISQALRYNKDYISRVVKQLSGKTLKEYIVCERLYAAKTMLAYENIPLSKIAESTGYESQELFTKFFRYYTKISPLEYRRQFQKE